jgi:hypothetical protein
VKCKSLEQVSFETGSELREIGENGFLSTHLNIILNSMMGEFNWAVHDYHGPCHLVQVKVLNGGASVCFGRIRRRLVLDQGHDEFFLQPLTRTMNSLGHAPDAAFIDAEPERPPRSLPLLFMTCFLELGTFRLKYCGDLFPGGDKSSALVKRAIDCNHEISSVLFRQSAPTDPRILRKTE